MFRNAATALAENKGAPVEGVFNQAECRNTRTNSEVKIENNNDIKIDNNSLTLVLKFLAAPDIARASNVNKRWKKLANEKNVWQSELNNPKVREKLQAALLHAATKTLKPKLIDHYCQIGADVNMRTDFDVLIGMFPKPTTILTIAAVKAGGNNKFDKKKIIKILLKHGADVSAVTHCVSFEVYGAMGGVGYARRENLATAAQLTRSRAVKTTLVLFEFEVAIKANKPISDALKIIQNAKDCDENKIALYFKELMSSEGNFIGEHHTFTESELKRLKTDLEFLTYSQKNSRPSRCVVM